MMADMVDSADSVPIEPQPRAAGAGGRASVLVVEDDAAMREMLREALEEDG